MNHMLKDYLNEPGCQGIIRAVDGRLKRFRRHGVIDLLELAETEPEFMNGASAADRVIGRGAALLLAYGKVGSVYARLISSSALKVLREAGITVSFGTETPCIRNRKGDGQCPVEALTANVNDPAEAVNIIRTFIENQKNKQ